MFGRGDEVVAIGGEHDGKTGVVEKMIDDDNIVVRFYNDDAPVTVPAWEIEDNDYAGGEDEEDAMRLSMGDEEYDRMHGNLGYNDEYEESLDDMRRLSGMS